MVLSSISKQKVTRKLYYEDLSDDKRKEGEQKREMEREMGKKAIVRQSMDQRGGTATT